MKLHALNLKLEHKVYYWKDIIQALQRDRIDAICSAATVTADREKALSLSRPYLDFHLCVVVHKDRKFFLNDLIDKKIGVRTATEAESYLKNKFPDAQMRFSDTNDELYEALSNKKIDALIDDSPIAYGFSRQNDQIVVAELIVEIPSKYAILIRKDNLALKSKIDIGIEKLHMNGFLTANRIKWFDEATL
jgi:ABC-type amino acid transport substrate-binding protein